MTQESTSSSVKGSILSVNISTETGTIKKPIDLGRLDHHGLAGDAHAGDWHRQVSVLASESIESFARIHGRSFAPGEFAENVTTQGIDILAVALLDRFTVGEAELEVTQIGKKCHGGECAVFREVGQCVMPKEGIFCRVLRGGPIRPGDAITWRPRPLRFRIITLSDRAAKGVYEDRSGPRVEALVGEHFAGTRWRLAIEREVMADDAEALRNALASARDTGVDVVVTTGGTGIGPHDITPDVVASMADKVIPGIMEHIRVKYGATIPNALLSRSIAAVIGRTLIYTLPGSVRAVEEYLAEILGTVEHAICMLHALDTH